MSKEKNLTYLSLHTGKVSVDSRSHEWVRYSRSGIRCDQLNGPAIDRLYEFEKLGMEPEEIKEILNSNLVKALRENVTLRDLNQRLYNKIYALQEEIDDREQVRSALYREIGQLSELVRLQRGTIDKYVDEEVALKKKLNSSVNSNKVLQKQIEYYQDKLKEINRVLEEDTEEAE